MVGVALALIVAGCSFMNVGAPAIAVASPTPPAVTPPPTAADSPTAAPTQDSMGIVLAFFEALQSEMQWGSQEIMADVLAPAVIERYGQSTCVAYLSSRDPAPEQVFRILAVHDPAPWDYVSDGRTTKIPDATTVDAMVTSADANGVVSTQVRELHVQFVAGVGPLVHRLRDAAELGPLGLTAPLRTSRR